MKRSKEDPWQKRKRVFNDDNKDDGGSRHKTAQDSVNMEVGWQNRTFKRTDLGQREKKKKVL